jgi:hypothetical protein
MNNRLINTNVPGGGGGGGTACELDILGDGSCVATYQLDGNVSDLSGNYDGTPVGTLLYPTGVFGQAINPSSFGAGWRTEINLSGSQTYSLWANIDNSGTSYKVVFWSDTANTIRLFSYNSNEFVFNVGSASITLPYASLNNSWHHFALVVNNNSSIQMYVDGNLYDSAAVGSVGSTNFMDFGGSHRSGSYFARRFLGSVDQVRVFNKALSAEEVTTLYNETACQIPVVPDSFNTVTYTGNGGSQSITGVGFKPDLVWIKDRTGTGNNVLFDSVRGAERYLMSNQTLEEVYCTNYSNYCGKGVNSFDSDGFSVTDSTGLNFSVSYSSRNYVAWCWKAGGAAVTNNDGSITSQVSANPDAGFSVVSYTAPSTAIGYTVGHGLNTAPSLIIVKDRDNTIGYPVFSSSLATAQQKFLLLNTTAAASTSTNMWNNTLPTNSVFSQRAGYSTNTNAKSIAYCFAEVPGFSKFGTYVGTGITNNPTIDCGFEPAFVLIKSTSHTMNWALFDNKRDTINPNDAILYPNLSLAETNSSGSGINFLSNGFEINTTNGGWINTAGYNFMYIAFANQF